MVLARFCLLFVSLHVAAAIEAFGDQTDQKVELTNGPASGQLKVCSSSQPPNGDFEGTTYTIQSNNHIEALMHYEPAYIAKIQLALDPESPNNHLPHVAGMDASCNGACYKSRTLPWGQMIPAGRHKLCLVVGCHDVTAPESAGVGATCTITYSVKFHDPAPPIISAFMCAVIVVSLLLGAAGLAVVAFRSWKKKQEGTRQLQLLVDRNAELASVQQP